MLSTQFEANAKEKPIEFKNITEMRQLQRALQWLLAGLPKWRLEMHGMESNVIMQ